MAPTVSNLLIDKFPPALRTKLLAAGEPVALPVRTLLFSPTVPPKYLHFITSGAASLVTTMSSGDSVEVNLFGREGVPEAIYLLGPAPVTSTCFIQVPATAHRIEFNRFQAEFFSQEPVLRVILEHIQYNGLLTAQIAACNRLHDVEERAARWLLMVADRLGEQKFLLTQEFLAEMIGSRRSTVTLTAGAFKRSGLIDYRRGELRILDREALEEVACECYPITRKLLQSVTARPPYMDGAAHDQRPAVTLDPHQA